MLVTAAVLVCGGIISIFLFLVFSHAVEDRARLRFERETSEAKGLIDLRIQFHMSVLYGLRALFGTHEHVSRLDFHRYVESLKLPERYVGFDVVNFAARVSGSERSRFEQAVRADTTLDPQGYPEFAIKPPGERAEYHVMVYLEPMAPFRFAFGLDIAASPLLDADHRELLALQHETRDTGNLIASGRPIRVKRNPEYVGLAIRLAAYRAGLPLETVEHRRAAFIGTVGAGFNVNSLMKDALSPQMAQYMRFRMFDVGPLHAGMKPLPPGNERLLFDNRASADGIAPTDAYFTRDLTTAVGGRLWQIKFDAPKNAVIDRVDALLPWLVLVGGLFSTLLLTGFFYSLASAQRRAVALAKDMTKDLRQTEAALRASAEQLSALSRRLVEVQEAERRQLARELHDRVGQNLTALSINLDILGAQLANDLAGDSRARLEESSALVDSTADAIDNVMTELRPPMLDDYGLLSALHWYAKEFSRRMGLQVTVSGDDSAMRPPPDVEITLFRVAQEALTNVAKHARASHIEIRLEHIAGSWIMSIRDDGIGLATSKDMHDRARQGLGMVTMRERSQAVGGRFVAHPAPGGGTEVRITVPR